MSTEARRASLPPRPSHAPRTAGDPGPFDPRTPLDDTPPPPPEQPDRSAPDDTGHVGAPRSAPDGRDPSGAGDTGAGRDGRAYGAPGAWGDREADGAGSAGTPRPATGGFGDREATGTAGAGPTFRPSGDGSTGRPVTPPATSGERGPTGSGNAEPPYPPAGGRADDRAVTPTTSGGASERPRLPRVGADAPGRTAPPPPRASARFPDAPPAVGRGVPSARPAPSAPPRPAHRPRAEGASETTTRLRPVPAEPDPALSWNAPMPPGGVPGGGRPAAASFGEPERHPRPFARRTRGQVVAAAVCLVLGTGLIGGAVTGAWLADGPEGPGTRHAFAVAGDLWHEVPVDQLFPPTVQGRGAGPGEADRVWTRIAVAPDSGCKGAFDAPLARVLAPVGCERLLRATYTDATQSHVTTVGLLFTEADAAGMEALARRFDRERLDRRSDLMPLPYAAKDTAAEGFGPEQRASWAVSVLTDAPVVVYAVTGWADGRAVDEPQPAEDAMRSGATTAPAQAGLGHEARGLADRFERALRKRAGAPTERPS
ncbi:hypothetical protein [Streptomyces sp. NPDC093991]|uniref:hypothetical protein n=1 Tax=unclassified Streptomyces TaxID=2593676 RepID=UPI0034214520